MRVTPSIALLSVFLLGCTPPSNTDLRSVELERAGARTGAAAQKSRVEIDSLSTDDRIALEGLVMTADVLHQPEIFSGAPAADPSRYQLTVQYTGRKQVIVFHDHDDHPQSLDRLTVWIEAHH
jgi:hypothetical protein